MDGPWAKWEVGSGRAKRMVGGLVGLGAGCRILFLHIGCSMYIYIYIYIYIYKDEIYYTIRTNLSANHFYRFRMRRPIAVGLVNMQVLSHNSL